MKNSINKLVIALIITNLMGCGDSQQSSTSNGNVDTLSNQTATNKSDMIATKITN